MWPFKTTIQKMIDLQNKKRCCDVCGETRFLRVRQNRHAYSKTECGKKIFRTMWFSWECPNDRDCDYFWLDKDRSQFAEIKTEKEYLDIMQARGIWMSSLVTLSEAKDW